ncbi:MAG: hypothetical protein QG656_2145 [Candidatus Hydrogenedentes bacterium]|nr:hypothetical protein [Candidatus Hydrogenedentota bacterium]
MKHGYVAIGILIAAGALLTPATGSALTLDEANCAWLSDPDSGFDAAGGRLDNMFSILAWTTVPGTWQTYDLENAVAPYGDGILDHYQMAMLAAVLCASDKAIDLEAIRAAFLRNADQFTAMAARFQDIADLGPTLGPLAQNVGQGLLAQVSPATLDGTVVNVPNTGDTLRDMATYLDTVGTNVVTYQFVFAGIAFSAADYAPWFAGMYGLSTEMQARMDTILGGLVGLVGDLQPFSAVLTTQAPLLFAGGEIDAALRNNMLLLVPYLTDVSIPLPTFEVFQFAKATDEPFSAVADFNNDGTTNLNHFIQTQGAGGGRPEFVEAATAGVEEPLPAAGLLGLALAAGAMLSAGAALLRKRS